MIDRDIFDLMDRFERSSLQAMKLSNDGFTIELTRAVAAPAAPVAVSVPAAPAAAPAPEQTTQGDVITAPLVGTYYATPAPDHAPFVSVGDRVSKGQTVCPMEAKKMMSEVPAPCDCVIEEVLKASGELVAFGEPLFRYRAV